MFTIYDTQSFLSPHRVFSQSSGEELTVQVHQFQHKYPKTFRILDENNRESTLFRIDEKGHIYNKDVSVTFGK